MIFTFDINHKKFHGFFLYIYTAGYPPIPLYNIQKA